MLVPSSFSLWLRRVFLHLALSLLFIRRWCHAWSDVWNACPLTTGHVWWLPLTHKLLEGLQWNERSHSDTGRLFFFRIFDQLIAVSGKVEINVLWHSIIECKMLLVAHTASLQTCCSVQCPASNELWVTGLLFKITPWGGLTTPWCHSVWIKKEWADGSFLA